MRSKGIISRFLLLVNRLRPPLFLNYFSCFTGASIFNFIHGKWSTFNIPKSKLREKMSTTSSPRPFINPGTTAVLRPNTNPGSNTDTTKFKYVKSSCPTCTAATTRPPKPRIHTYSTSVSDHKVIKRTALPTKDVSNTTSSHVKPISYFETAVSSYNTAATTQPSKTGIHTYSTSVSTKVIKRTPLPTRHVSNSTSSQVKPTSYYETTVSSHNITRKSNTL